MQSTVIDSLPQAPSSVSSKALLPWLVAVAFFMEALDTTILNTAVPTISDALKVAPLSMKSVLASYTLSLAVFIPISGWMADRFGTRTVFASAIGLFTLGSFLCGISSDIGLLVACRVLQGCGGAMMVPVGRLTLVRTFARSELVRAMSFVAIPALVGPMLGPIAGGLIVGYLNWRFIFFVNLPIGIAGLILVYLHLPDYREKKTHPLDAVGFILFGSGVALLSYVLEVFGEHSLGARPRLAVYWPITAALKVRMRNRPSSSKGNFVRAKFGKIEPLHERVDHTNRIVPADPIIEAFRQKRRLPAIHSLDKPLHPLPRKSILRRK